MHDLKAIIHEPGGGPFRPAKEKLVNDLYANIS
jgi:hypothetical protein